MNVVRVWGGLGNQMFQYAFGRALANRTGEETRYDLSWFSRASSDRAYGLDAFACEVKTFDGQKARRMSRENWLTRLVGLKPKLKRVDESPANVYDERLLELHDSYVRGYFQAAAYYDPIRAELLAHFQLLDVPQQIKRLAEHMRSCESVSVHVRRGDYLRLQDVFHVCDQSYYERAARYVCGGLRVPKIFVFSDDIGWCRENLRLPAETEFVLPMVVDRPELDMFMMSRCRHHVIANSSFSWWGAWLNDRTDKVVVAPKRWYAERQTDIVPVNWKRL